VPSLRPCTLCMAISGTAPIRDQLVGKKVLDPTASYLHNSTPAVAGSRSAFPLAFTRFHEGGAR